MRRPDQRRPDQHRVQRFWDREAAGYDAKLSRTERRFFPTSRQWVCSRAMGRTLEVGIGTGLNLPHYPADVELLGVEFSPVMLEVAQLRSFETGIDVELHHGDAMELPFGDNTFDSVVCTFVMCTVPDDARGVAEMVRVLRPGGRLLMADHVVATSGPVRWLEHMIETVTIPLQGEHFTRRPALHVPGTGMETVETERLSHGAIEHLHAVK